MKKTIAQQLGIKDFPFWIRDKEGRVIYFEYSNRHWRRYEYDSDHNPIYEEDSKGYSARREYDSNNKQTFYKNSDGYWIKREYDSSGNRIYYENSEGEIIDNRPKVIITVNGIKYQRIEE